MASLSVGSPALASLLLLTCWLSVASSSLSSGSFALDLELPQCQGRRVFILPLPPKFNADLVFNPQHDNAPLDIEDTYIPQMIKKLETASLNMGFGKEIVNVMGVAGLDGAWYHTDQNTLENIFHARMEKYACRTEDWKQADLVYVPYYGAHDAIRHMHRDMLMRDRLPLQLAKAMRMHPAWRRANGSDFFLVLGRNVWDFRRGVGNNWGSKLLYIDGLKDNVWTVVVETGKDVPRVMSAPKPTGFHPQDRAQVDTWQKFVGSSERPWLFSFVGRRKSKGSFDGAFREKLFWQCDQSKDCELLDCSETSCHDPNNNFKTHTQSTFCLHPFTGSCTRKFFIDSILGGCIPVVFRQCSVDGQFDWHMGKNKTGTFVYIPLEGLKGPADLDTSAHPRLAGGEVLVEDILKSIPAEEVAAMRKKVIRLIPKLVYGGTPEDDAIAPPDFKDAFDLIIEGLAKHVAVQ